jgi:hypothetical protein
LISYEKVRIDKAREFRKLEKSSEAWDPRKYAEVKATRQNFNDVYDQLENRRFDINDLQTELATINNMLFHKQDTTSSVPTLNRERIQANLLANLDKEKLVEINGIDPGIYSTATMSSVTAGCLFDSINKFSVLSTGEDETSDFKSTFCVKRYTSIRE